MESELEIHRRATGLLKAVVRPVRLHGLRHGAASLAHCAGVELKNMQSNPGTAASSSSIVLPRFAVGMLLARQLVTADNPHDAIFASRRGTWLSPNNVRCQWRQARTDADLAWVTPHTFRKTVATLIKEEADTTSATAQLGHSSEDVTKTYYIAKPALAPDVSEILEKLSADHEPSTPASAA